MSLTNKYTVAAKRIPDLFEKIRDGQAPEVFSQQLLKDWGFTSSNDRALPQILKDLGFLSPDGKPTSRYHDYRDHSRSKAVMADGLREAYSDIFLIKEHPTTSDRKAIEGKFKSFHNASDNVAGLMAKNFFELLKLSDLTATPSKRQVEEEQINDSEQEQSEPPKQKSEDKPSTTKLRPTGLHYNIQVHLPATKDVEVYNAIFKSLREHLLEE